MILKEALIGLNAQNMVTDNKLVSLYLPADLYQALIAYQAQQAFDSTEAAVVEALAQFLHKGGQLKRYVTIEQFEALEGKVTSLSDQVTKLSQTLASSTATSSNSNRTESGFGNNSINPTYFAQQPSVFDPIDFEDAEEEPYEILYSFLEPESPSINGQF